MGHPPLAIDQRQIGQVRQCRHFLLEEGGTPRLLFRVGGGELQFCPVNLVDDITEQVIGKLECLPQPFADQQTGVFYPDFRRQGSLVVGVHQLLRHHKGEDQAQRRIQQLGAEGGRWFLHGS